MQYTPRECVDAFDYLGEEISGELLGGNSLSDATAAELAALVEYARAHA